MVFEFNVMISKRMVCKMPAIRTLAAVWPAMQQVASDLGRASESLRAWPLWAPKGP